jgi:glutamyl-Q tRNA(Asp) synthetase
LIPESLIPGTAYCGRFAPSPTGPLHFGSLVAAVASYLEARVRGGEWLVRREDVDTPRTVAGAADDILRTLDALGMTWDGDVMYQSARSEAYRAAFERLQRDGKVYPCGCSRREIADSAVFGIENYVYPGTCRPGLAEGRGARSWRVLTNGPVVAFTDAIQGLVAHDLERDIGDFVLYRADSLYAYQLAVVVDDADQGITHVVRGADLLDSTPRQIYLQRLLGYPTPYYAHLPVAVNAAGQKLSKQTLAPAVDVRNAGAALVSALAFLGQGPPVGLARASIADVWRWARDNWRLQRIARKRTITVT